MLIRADDDCTVPETPLTLRAWIQDGHALGHPTEDDVAYHLTTLFPPIRPRGWLELRMLDALPEPWWHVAAAVTVTALVDARHTRPAGAGGLRGTWALARRGLARRPPRRPRRTGAGGGRRGGAGARPDRGTTPTLIERAEEFAATYVARRRSLADDLLESWQEHGTLAPPPEAVPAQVR